MLGLLGCSLTTTNDDICNFTRVWGFSIYRDRLIFGFLSWYPKLWFRKIFSDLNLIYKIPKFHITSAHLTNFQSSQISPSGTLSTIWALAKYWRLAYALYSRTFRELWQVVLGFDILNIWLHFSRKFKLSSHLIDLPQRPFCNIDLHKKQSPIFYSKYFFLTPKTRSLMVSHGLCDIQKLYLISYRLKTR